MHNVAHGEAEEHAFTFMFKGEVAWIIEITAAANRPQQPQMTWSRRPLQMCIWSLQC